MRLRWAPVSSRWGCLQRCSSCDEGGTGERDDKGLHIHWRCVRPLVIQHSHGKWPIEIDGLPIKNGDFPDGMIFVVLGLFEPLLELLSEAPQILSTSNVPKYFCMLKVCYVWFRKGIALLLPFYQQRVFGPPTHVSTWFRSFPASSLPDWRDG